ncbi:glycine/D-amino acid oxidase-like deaminating enzyme [Roseovarius sp. MBR-78]|uniref:NAD(P)/FAD-dependent oxidoreductase n=1 Tax=Roseovarius sp. MBR-78 TaxID=3156460 RepID=UPI00339201DD
MTAPRTIIVIGAGICGLASAIWLTRAGHRVTLLDRDHPGAGASFGNAGLLAQWAIVPVNTPGVLTTALKYLTDRDAPLWLRWRDLPRLAPWLWQFARNANPTDAARMIEGLIPLVTDSVDQHRALVRGTLAEKWLATSDLAYAYDSRAAFDADSYSWAAKRAAGFTPEVIEGAAVREAEPLLGPAIQCLAILRAQGHILDPGAYMADLATLLQAEGGRYLRAEARDVTLTDGRITEVLTDQGPLPCDAAVVAAGVWSKPLMEKLGLRVPLVAERGYHLHLAAPSQMPRQPLMMARGKFGVTPMATGLRCAGTVELGHPEAPPSHAPFAMIQREIARVLPDLSFESAEEWMGCRPSTPDSLPLIGEIGGTGVFAAFGHQHVGLTAGPRTGRLIADLLSDRRPNIDLAPYDANRF